MGSRFKQQSDRVSVTTLHPSVVSHALRELDRRQGSVHTRGGEFLMLLCSKSWLMGDQRWGGEPHMQTPRTAVQRGAFWDLER